MHHLFRQIFHPGRWVDDPVGAFRQTQQRGAQDVTRLRFGAEHHGQPVHRRPLLVKQVDQPRGGIGQRTSLPPAPGGTFGVGIPHVDSFRVLGKQATIAHSHPPELARGLVLLHASGPDPEPAPPSGRKQILRRLRVVDGGDETIAERERGHGHQGAAATTGVVNQRFALGITAGHFDGKLMAHNQRLSSRPGCRRGVLDRGSCAYPAKLCCWRRKPCPRKRWLLR